MVALTVLEQMVSLMLIALAAFFMARKGLMDARITAFLSAYIMLFALPGSIMHSMLVPYEPEKLVQIAVVSAAFVASLAISMLCCLPYCLVRRFNPRQLGISLCCAAFPNSLFIGRPLILAIFGDEAAFPVTALMFIFNICCFSVGTVLISLDGNGGKIDLRGILRAFLNPAMLAVLIGLVMFRFSITLPSPLMNTCTMLSATVTPVSMLIIGYSLAQLRLREALLDANVHVVTFIRLIAAPVLTALVLRPFIADRIVYGVMVISMAMPVAATNGVLEERYHGESAFSSKAIFVSNILCIATVPLVALLFNL